MARVLRLLAKERFAVYVRWKKGVKKKIEKNSLNKESQVRTGI